MKHDKLKIVVTGTRGIPDVLGGVETHCQELFPLIAEDDNLEITIIRRTNYNSCKENTYKGVSLVDIDSPKLKSLEAIIHTFKAVLYAKFKINADIIHIHAIGPAIMIPFAKLLGMKVVFTHHGFDYDREKWGKLAKIALKIGERLGTKYADKVIVISNVIKSTLERKYKRFDLELIYNGVPEKSNKIDSEYLKLLNLENKKFILALGRFVPEKNFHHLIEAYKNIDNKDIALVIAGDSIIDDEYSLRLKTMAKDNDVILPGFIKGVKLSTLLNEASLFVLPSSHEGLPISMLEAMSYSLPIVASDIPSNMEVKLSNESYFSLGKIDELTKTINDKLINTPKLKYDLDKYNWHYIKDKTSIIYYNL